MSKILRIPANYLFVAAPRTGKTYNIKYLLSKFCNSGELQYGLVFTNTDDYDDMVPKKYIFKYLDSKIVNKMLLKLINIQRREKAQQSYMPPSFVVFDDCLDFNFNTPFFKRFISECVGHYNISTFIGVQHLLAIKNPVVYRSISICYIFYQDDDRTLKTLYNEYGGSLFANHQKMKETVIAECQNRQVLIIDVNQSDKTKKMVKFKTPKYKVVRFLY